MVDIEKIIEMVHQKSQLSSSEIRSRAQKQIDNVSGLINLEGGLLITVKELGLNIHDFPFEFNYYKAAVDTLDKSRLYLEEKIKSIVDPSLPLFLDIDDVMDEDMNGHVDKNNIRTFFEHLTLNHENSDHKQVYIRRSFTSNHYHVMVYDYCGVCTTFGDPDFNGVLFFNNKGTKFIANQWCEYTTNKFKSFPVTNIIHMLVRSLLECDDPDNNTIDSYIINHYMVDVSYFKKNFDQIMKDIVPNDVNCLSNEIYYTFHSAILQQPITLLNPKKISGDKDRTIEELIELHSLIKFESLSELMKRYYQFVVKLPTEYQL